MLDHKTNINAFKRKEVIQSMFSNLNEMELEINRKKFGTHRNMWKLNNTVLNNNWVNKEMKRKVRKYFEVNENEDTKYQDLWDAVKIVLREMPSFKRRILNE